MSVSLTLFSGPSQPGLIFHRRPFRAQPDRAIFAGSNPPRVAGHLLDKKEGRCLGFPAPGPTSTNPTREREKNCPAGNGDGVLQAPSALTVHRLLLAICLGALSGTQNCSCSRGHRKLGAGRLLRPASPPALARPQARGEWTRPWPGDAAITDPSPIIRLSASPPPTNVPPPPSPVSISTRNSLETRSSSPGTSISAGVVADSSLNPVLPDTDTNTDTESSARSSHHHAIAAAA